MIGLRVDVLGNLGAYATLFGAGCASVFGAGSSCGPYRIPAAYFRTRAVYTHTVPCEAYRGAGMPEATNVIERLMDAAAAATGSDPYEYRLRQLMPSHLEPARNVLGVTHDSGSYREVGELLRAAYEEWRAYQRRESERLIGIGIAGYVMQASGGPSRENSAVGSRFSNWEHARISVHPGGEITLTCGTHSHGQGHETTFRQLVADRLGCEAEDIEVIYGDTARVHAGMGTYTSRALVTAGSAIAQASERLIEKGRTLAAHLLECALEDVAFGEGEFRVAGTDRMLGFREIAAAAWRGGQWPENFEPGLDVTCYVDPALATTPSGFHLCVIELDEESGAVKLLDYVAADDFGRVVNPLIVDGQVHGGVAQGLGQALSECCVYDDVGQLLAGSALDYAIPRADDLPSFVSHRLETPSPANPLGVKGMGETGTLPAPPAVANALRDVLTRRGGELPDMPFTANRLWESLRARKPHSG